MTTRRNTVHDKLDSNLRYYAENVLKIGTKGGGQVPLVLNTAQEFLHKRLESQLRTLGYVRALIIKGRQQGCSTYVAARYYHKAVRQHNKRVFILCHEAQTTQALFDMVERYYDNTPTAVRPKRDTANTRQHKYNAIDSQYTVGTAGNDSVGRGGTIQLFHGSEVAYWEKTDGLETGILESVADLPGTEIILESTANGMSNFFYEKTMEALDGGNDYQVIFIPWYWQEEYRRDTPADGNMDLSEEETEYKERWGLENDQMYWRRAKVTKNEWKFKQEYPSNLMEAFQTSGDTLISAEAISDARKSTITDKHAPLVLGIDPGRNHDRTIFAPRRGREYLPYETFVFNKQDNVQMIIAGKAAKWIDDNDPTKVFIDVGHGYGVIDRLKELGYGNVVMGVHFGSAAIDDSIYVNKRAEMWMLLRDHIHGEDGQVSLPDNDSIQRDLMSMPESTTTSSGKHKFPLKTEIKKKLGMSPDIGDGYALTHAYPVAPHNASFNNARKIKKKINTKNVLSTLQRFRKPNKITRTGR